MQHLYIVNSSGSLVYHYSGVAGLTEDDNIAIGSTFFGLFAMANECSPKGACVSGLEEVCFSSGTIVCFESRTGLKFIASADKTVSAQQLRRLLRAVYIGYADYVQKNPYYLPDQPIRLPKFEEAVHRSIRSILRPS
ncbi:Sybindin-like family protein [Giardia muris]|uniref:Trafficking protein particle complex subunit n=1 Tax=Giardia muris TaxID=5742 RepID=A0A4Z1SZ96_GIAMU|nr:Sybindin-like family protein [Giardia muris]|eukprot:TNJ28808.1 Sybindin-like family protein [Giardia muris]